MSKLINVVSGKGGTGKTLMTVVLADILSLQGAKVLVVDMDIFVCGVTTMFFYENLEAMRLTKEDNLSVSDYFLKRKEYQHSAAPMPKPAILHYPSRSFDIIPSLKRINQEYRPDSDLLPNDAEDAEALIKFLMRTLPVNDYDYIFFDNRAGYDPLVEAVHSRCDFSLCVEEDDDISLITSDRLIYLLDSSKPVYRIRNKVRSDSPKETLRMGLDFLGAIDFEFNVFNTFGTARFWSSMAQTGYRRAVCVVWNCLAKKEELEHKIELSNDPAPKKRSSLSVLDRGFALSGFLLAILGLFSMFFTAFLSTRKPDYMQLSVILMTILLGIFMMILSVVNIPRLLKNFRRED